MGYWYIIVVKNVVNVSSCYKCCTQNVVKLEAVYTIDKIWKCLSGGSTPVMNILNYDKSMAWWTEKWNLYLGLTYLLHGAESFLRS
jgi:hypothetical protein